MEAFGGFLIMIFLVLPGVPFAILFEFLERKLTKVEHKSPAAAGVFIVISGLCAIPVTITGIGFLIFYGATNAAAIWAMFYLVSWTVVGILQIK
jgi:hypothetical protein